MDLVPYRKKKRSSQVNREVILGRGDETTRELIGDVEVGCKVA
jgi:hypothetical protein